MQNLESVWSYNFNQPATVFMRLPHADLAACDGAYPLHDLVGSEFSDDYVSALKTHVAYIDSDRFGCFNKCLTKQRSPGMAGGYPARWPSRP